MESQADLALPDQMGGILRTGDLAVFDNDGMARIIGRKNVCSKSLVTVSDWMN